MIGKKPPGANSPRYLFLRRDSGARTLDSVAKPEPPVVEQPGQEERLWVDPRNRLILRRTLSAISHLHAVWSALLGWGFLAVPPKGDGVLSSRWVGALTLVHAAALFGAGWALWKPRRRAAALTLGAVALSFALMAQDGLGHRWQSLGTDGLYPIVALGILWETRRP
jgi:hypothetical protein